MKVAFWNTVGFSNSVTNYPAAIATILAMEKSCNVVLGSNYISNHMLQDCFSSRIKEEGIAHAPYQYFYGTTEYFRALWDMRINRQGDILEMPMEGITIIYPPDVTDKSMFYYEVPPDVLYLLDIAGENNAASQSALEEADIVVVFLSQDVTEIQKFFDRFSSLIPKTLFIIVDYKKNKKVTPRTVSAKYGIDVKNIGSIPHNNEYTEACEEGRLEFFLRSNLKQATKEPLYNFITSLRTVTKLLFERSKGSQEKE